MQVNQIMTQQVASISPDATIIEAAQLMLKERVGGLPVINGGHALVGIITESDLLRRVEAETEKSPRSIEIAAGVSRLATEYIHSHSRKVRDVMTTDVAVATEEMALRDVVDIMEEQRLKRLPVVRAGRVVGMVARADVLRAIAAPPARIPGDDAAIREQIWSELCKQPWNAARGHITVREGVVDIWGVITSERQREAIQVAVEGVPGVRSVRDHLLWVETR
ncbi:MAG: CBS domain-containing protein [Rhodospirillaceae bacterium]